MARKKSAPRGRSRKAPSAPQASATERDRPLTDEELQGPPPREATMMRTDRERDAEREAAQFAETSPELAGGDVDADWQRAASVGEEAPGGTVATPDQNVVDEYGEALGVPRAPEEELRTSQEILEQRDRYRWEQEEG
ncbi:MAG: hypothetical protein HYR51_05565 [Candidatus Rokubacteria bacterium]|nr:hypothetical protein [Candidatus Rokubacteria bacterium]